LQKRRPDNPEVLIGLARCHYDLHKLDQARQFFDQVLAGHPESVPALLDRGQLEFHAGQMAEAKIWLGRAAKLAPWNHEVYRALSLCLQTEGTEAEQRACQKRLEQIEATTKQVDVLIEEAKHSPPDAPLRYQIAVQMAGMGRQEDAVSWYFSALGDDPHYQPAHTALADYFQQTGQLFRAARQRQLAHDEKAK
jgi:tetratricopeptide (TPR) repeat protein